MWQNMHYNTQKTVTIKPSKYAFAFLLHYVEKKYFLIEHLEELKNNYLLKKPSIGHT